MIRKFRHFYKFRAAAALVPAIVVMMAVAGTHAAAQDETAGGSPPAAGKMFRVAVKTLRPVAVIDRRDIEMSGLTNVGELLLSRAVFNSFGLHRPFVLGTGRAAVLVNGRRISDSTFDLDMLPIVRCRLLARRKHDEACAAAGGKKSTSDLLDGATKITDIERSAVADGGTVNPPRNRKGGAGNPPPTGVRASALPYANMIEARVFTMLLA